LQSHGFIKNKSITADHFSVAEACSVLPTKKPERQVSIPSQWSKDKWAFKMKGFELHVIYRLYSGIIFLQYGTGIKKKMLLSIEAA